jgi:micrococcal nuclease
MDSKRFIILCIVLLIFLVISAYEPESTSDTIKDFKKEPALVLEIIDGDTIKTDIGEVRLLGVNTPEKGKPLYHAAKQFLKQIENKSIELLRDKEDLDRYERKLRYVFYQGRLINLEIIEQGLGTTFMEEGLEYESKLFRAELAAKSQEVGLWQKSNHECSKCIILTELNPKEEFFIIKNNCTFDCNISAWTVKDNANHFFKLDSLNQKEAKQYESQNIWNNDKDKFFMRDEEGKLVLFYEYSTR